MKTRFLSFFRFNIILIAVILTAVVSSALAQTGIVDFRNNQTDFPTPADRDVYHADFATPLIGTNFQARLLVGADASSLQPTTSVTPARFRNVTTGAATAGTWVGGNRTLTGFLVGQVVTLQVQAWDAGPSGLRSYDETVAIGGLYGFSNPFSYTIPAPGSAPTAYYMDNFRGIPGMIPEPSVVALGALGLVALIFFKRHKP